MPLLGHFLRHGRLHRDGLDHGHRVHVRYGDSFSGQNHPLWSSCGKMTGRADQNKTSLLFRRRNRHSVKHRHTLTYARQTMAYLDSEPIIREKNVFSKNFLAKSSEIYHDRTRGK